jgi:RNA-directed DNA polymerase
MAGRVAYHRGTSDCHRTRQHSPRGRSGRYLRARSSDTGLGEAPPFWWWVTILVAFRPWSASPDDPGLAQYWVDRRRRMTTPLGRSTLRLLHKQDSRCAHCGDFLLHADHQPRSPEQWEQWIRTTRQAMRKQRIAVAGRPGNSDDEQLRLVHTHCLRRTSAVEGRQGKHF